MKICIMMNKTLIIGLNVNIEEPRTKTLIDTSKCG